MNDTKPEPRAVWSNFYWICAIPHPSHHEAALSRALAAWAEERGLPAATDAAGNVVIRKAASPGRQGSAAVILQSHLDMVAQAEPGSGHDFLNDPIRPRPDPSDPEWLMATGTTLGADDGIGVAMAMAILEDPAASHGPLECVFTVNEEDGMSGARALEPGVLGGRVLINLDGELENELTVGCAGSVRTYGSLSAEAVRAPADTRWLAASVGGLSGGHSGVDIDKGRANAAITLARILSASGPARMASLSGGDAANAIPREARAVIGLEERRLAAFRAAFLREAEVVGAELRGADPGFRAVIGPAEAPAEAWALDEARSSGILGLIASSPNGLVAMEPDMPGSIRSSLNLGRVAGSAKAGTFALETMVLARSSSDAEREAMAAAHEAHLSRAAAFGWTVSSRRPATLAAWPPNLRSPLLAKARSAYRDLFGADPLVTATHGGLECGIFRPLYPDLDMISLGPTIQNPHSPGERVHIPSVGRSYRLLKTLLESL